MSGNLRLRRAQLGLSQAELAARAGLSRQMVGAVESGRHSPSVRAALALAAALECSVEDLFAAEREVAAPALDAAPDGTLVEVARVGDRLTYAALPDRGAGTRSWRAADGVIGGGEVTLFPGARAAGAAVAGCDPALGLAAELLPRAGPERLVAIHASSGAALAALDSGRVHAALVHGPAKVLASLHGGVRLPVSAWEVGLASRPGLRVELERLADGPLRVARRDPGAASQQALERALTHLGAPALRSGPVASGHLDAARRVVYGSADVAVTMRAAALAYGLEFRALERHLVELRFAQEWISEPGVRALGEVLASTAFRSRVASVGGYELP